MFSFWRKAESTPEHKVINDQNKVLVRVWLPQSYISDVGHASLETFTGGYGGKGIYMSLWPANTKTKSLDSVPPKFNTYEEDLIAEQRPPEIKICLYSLNVEAINHAYENLIQQVKAWRLLGSPTTREKQSCSGAVMDLLLKGGINLLIARIESAAADWGVGLTSGIASTGLVTYSALTLGLSNPLGLAVTAVSFAVALTVNEFVRNTIADVASSPTDVAKYVLYAKKEEKKRVQFIGDDEVHVDLSKHKTIFNFEWINESDFVSEKPTTSHHL